MGQVSLHDDWLDRARVSLAPDTPPLRLEFKYSEFGLRVEG